MTIIVKADRTQKNIYPYSVFNIDITFKNKFTLKKETLFMFHVVSNCYVFKCYKDWNIVSPLYTSLCYNMQWQLFGKCNIIRRTIHSKSAKKTGSSIHLKWPKEVASLCFIYCIKHLIVLILKKLWKFRELHDHQELDVCCPHADQAGTILKSYQMCYRSFPLFTPCILFYGQHKYSSTNKCFSLTLLHFVTEHVDLRLAYAGTSVLVQLADL